MPLLRKCEHGYTMRERCEKCGATRSAHPARFRERFVAKTRGA